MKVILLAKVPGLGDVEDIKDVAEGYAVNFLFPRHLAVLASSKAVENLSIARAKKAKLLENDLKLQQLLASRLDGLAVTIKEKTNDAGLFYAAIGQQKIFDALQKMGFDVVKNNIIIKAIKEPGEYDIPIKLRHGLEVRIHLIAIKSQ
jgi:large subunit ribosomal protein L9